MIQERIDLCYNQELYYLDLSNLQLNNNDIFNDKNIIELLKEIEILDLSNNNLTELFDINLYSNITVLNIENNNITSNLNLKYIKELNCSNNFIENITSNNLNILIAPNNKLTNISHLKNVVYLDCTDNPIEKIEYLEKLYHLVCSTNNVSNKFNIDSVEKYDNYYIVNIIT
jgi:Leucine-rich repeat (LRR) protein